jgi:hypothetical protein
LVFVFKISNTWIYASTTCPGGSMLVVKRAQPIAISYVKHQQWRK